MLSCGLEKNLDTFQKMFFKKIILGFLVAILQRKSGVYMKRRAAREKALQLLFQADVGKNPIDEVYHYTIKETEHDEFIRQIVFGTVEHLEELDRLIEDHLINWTLPRLANVDKNILRMAVYEMKYMDDIPVQVTINEAIEIAKKFGDAESGRFVNGVLARIKETLQK